MQKMCVIACILIFGQKTTNSNCQGMLNFFQHALVIADSTIDHPVPLEINRKNASMKKGVLMLSKIGLLIVHPLSVFLVF
jgi:hypothetical protein